MHPANANIILKSFCYYPFIANCRRKISGAGFVQENIIHTFGVLSEQTLTPAVFTAGAFSTGNVETSCSVRDSLSLNLAV